MANEVRWTYTSEVTLEASGASAASTVFVAANDDTLESGAHLHFPLADFALNCDFGAAVNGTSVIRLYRHALNIQGTNDPPVPATTYKHLHVGNFVIPSGTSATGWYPLTDVPLIADQQYYIENGSDQNLSAGWKLYAIPKTYEPI